MDARTRNLVRQRAHHCCEYCRVPDYGYELPFHVEHIIANVHQPNDDLSNLAWACPRCNLYKGTNLVTLDPDTGGKVDVFNPRTDKWDHHFVMEDFTIKGLTDVGRGTVKLLRMNTSERIDHRREMMR